MNNEQSQILLTINLEAGTVLRKSDKSEKILSNITKSTVLGKEFVDYVRSNEACVDAGIRIHQWKKMTRGQRLNEFIKTIVADELKLKTEELMNNTHFNWSLVE
jgi:hypothetical protein